MIGLQLAKRGSERGELYRALSITQLTRSFSPEDQTFLEAAYKRDPKPDKAARLEIVKQVALGEKEVQVGWQD